MKVTINILVIFLMFISTVGYAQNIAINANGASPDSSAMLDVSDTTRGFLPPRMNTLQMNNINNPADGLFIYNTDSLSYMYYNGSSWINVGSGSSSASSSVDSSGNSGVLFLKDVKNSAIDGGGFTSGSWQTRDMNTKEGDTSFVSLSSNEFTLNAGVYLIEANAPAFQVGLHRIRIYNVTDASSQIKGANSYSINNSNEGQTIAVLQGVIDISSSKTFRLEHHAQISKPNNGFGPTHAVAGETELYSQIKIIKLDKVFGSGVRSSTSSSSADTLKENHFSARISSVGGIISENQNFISSVNNSATGTYDVSFVAGFFTVAPKVSGSVEEGTVSVPRILTVRNVSSSGCTIYIHNEVDGANEVNSDFGLDVSRQGSDYKYNTSSGSHSSSSSTTSVDSASESGVLLLKDSKANTVAGGTFTSGAWRIRDLNDLSGDTSFVAVNTNEFTLNEGVYSIEWSAPAFGVDNHKSRLYNVTAASSVQIGSQAAASPSNNGMSYSHGSAIVDVSSTTAFRIEHRCGTTKATNGLGNPSNTSDEEIYTQVKIIKLDQVFGGAGNSVSSSDTVSFIQDADGNTQILAEQTPNDDTIRFVNAGVQSMTITPSGNVGIGNTQPTRPLEVFSETTTPIEIKHNRTVQYTEAIRAFNDSLGDGDEFAYVLGKSPTTNNAAWMGYRHVGNGNDTNALIFNIWNKKRILNITGQRRVGINTLTPEEDLDVNGTATIDTLNINSAYTFPTSTPTSGQVLRHNGTTLEWGASSSDTLSLIQDADGNTKIQVEESGNDDIIRFDMSGTEFFRMDSGRIEVVNTGNSVFLGDSAGYNDDYSANVNTLIGFAAGKTLTTGEENVLVGWRAGRNATGSYNVALGGEALMTVGSNDQNTAVGDWAMRLSQGQLNTALGAEALYENTGDQNVAIGYLAFGNTSGGSGSGNVAIGAGAGSENSGSDNIFIGNLAGASIGTISNQLYIDNSGTSTPLIYGDFAADSLVINGSLSIGSNYTFPTTIPTSGQVLTYNGSELEWGTASNMYGSDGSLTADRTITQSTRSLTFNSGISSGTAITIENNVSGISGSALTVTSSGTRTIGNSGMIINNTVTKVGGSNSTKVGMEINSIGSWAPGTINQPNVGIKVTASGADDNYALQLIDGSQAANRVLTSDGFGNATWQNATNIYGADGSLSSDRVVTLGTSNLDFNISSTGIFSILDAGSSIFQVGSTGATTLGGDMTWRDINTGGTILARLIDDVDDGYFSIYENGNESIRLDANTGVTFNEQGLSRFFRIESDLQTNMFYVNAVTNRIGIGTSIPNEELDVEGDIEIDGEYTYETVKTKYLTISNVAFSIIDVGGVVQPRRDMIGNTSYILRTVGGTTGNTTAFGAPVYLPEGAIITNMEAYVFDSDATYDLTVSLNRQTWNSSAQTSIASVSTTGSTGSQTINDNTITVGTVSNSAVAYQVVFQTREANTSLGLYNVRITYTVSKAD